MKPKLFRLSEDSERDIATIMERYACESTTQAVRLALRILAQCERLDVVLPETPKHGRRTPKDHTS